ARVGAVGGEEAVPRPQGEVHGLLPRERRERRRERDALRHERAVVVRPRVRDARVRGVPARDGAVDGRAELAEPPRDPRARRGVVVPGHHVPTLRRGSRETPIRRLRLTETGYRCTMRSEERRVGKECTEWWSRYQLRHTDN